MPINFSFQLTRAHLHDRHLADNAAAADGAGLRHPSGRGDPAHGNGGGPGAAEKALHAGAVAHLRALANEARAVRALRGLVATAAEERSP